MRQDLHTCRGGENSRASCPKTVSHFSGWVFECPRTFTLPDLQAELVPFKNTAWAVSSERTNCL